MEFRAPIAIVGNGGAAAETVLALRGCGYDGDIHLFSENRRAPYNPTLGTYILSGALPVGRAFPFGSEREFYGGNRIAAHLGRAVTSIDALEQRLITSDGCTWRYDRCLVATGAHPSVPPVRGLSEALTAPGGARRVFVLRTLGDALDLKVAVDRVRARPGRQGRAAVIGASFVGVKAAAALRDLGLHVCLIEREPTILPLVAHPRCAQTMQDHLLEEGYELCLGVRLSGIEVRASRGQKTGSAQDPRGLQTCVRLEFAPGDPTSPGGGPAGGGNEPEEDFDIVVVATGTRPSLECLVPGQVETAEGILVDDQLRSSIPTLYAAGDVAQGRNVLSGRQEVIGLWSSARSQGRAAGRSLAGALGRYRGTVPHNITHVGRMLFATIGCMRECEHTTLDRDGDVMQMRAWQRGRLVGVNLLNCGEDAGVEKQALLKMAAGAMNEAEVTWTSFYA